MQTFPLSLVSETATLTIVQRATPDQRPTLTPTPAFRHPRHRPVQAGRWLVVAVALAVGGRGLPAFAQGDPADVTPTVEVYYDLAVESWQGDFGYINNDNSVVIILQNPPNFNFVLSNDPNLPRPAEPFGDQISVGHPIAFSPGVHTDQFRVPFGSDYYATWVTSSPIEVTAVAADGIASVVRPTTLLRVGTDGTGETIFADTYNHTAASNPLPLPNLEVWDGGTMNVMADLDADVTLVKDGGVANVLDGAFTVDTFLVVEAGGELRAIGGTVEANVAQVNAGGRLVASGGVQDVGLGLTNFGETVLIDTTINGDVDNRAGSTTTIVGNVIFNDEVSGPGAFFGPGTATFNGGFAPGASPAEVPVESSIALGAGNTLEIELAGLLPGEFDRLVIQGNATLDGLLELSLLSPFTPSLGDTFEILDVAGSLSGEFTGLGEGALLAAASGESFHISYIGDDGNDVVLTAVSGLAGDYNNDGVVDAADYTAWRDNLGAPQGALLNATDTGAIGAAQYATWKGNFGASLGGGSLAQSAVPEPASVLPLMLGAVVGYGNVRGAGRHCWPRQQRERGGVVA